VHISDKYIEEGIKAGARFLQVAFRGEEEDDLHQGRVEKILALASSRETALSGSR
jgi:hypothetical protein